MLTDYQEEIIYSVIPKEVWLSKYCPTLSDDLKNSVDKEYLQNHSMDFMTVWAQLLVLNFKTYVKAYLMQTLGFWQLGVFHGNYFDFWVGVQDLFDRGFCERDLICEFTGISFKPILRLSRIFIPSGTMVWIMLFAVAAALCQKDYRKKLLVLCPLVASWMVIMVATPIAYAYRYIVMLPMAFPIIFALPFYRFEEEKGLNT